MKLNYKMMLTWEIILFTPLQIFLVTDHDITEFDI